MDTDSLKYEGFFPKIPHEYIDPESGIKMSASPNFVEYKPTAIGAIEPTIQFNSLEDIPLELVERYKHLLDDYYKTYRFMYLNLPTKKKDKAKLDRFVAGAIHLGINHKLEFFERTAVTFLNGVTSNSDLSDSFPLRKTSKQFGKLFEDAATQRSERTNQIHDSIFGEGNDHLIFPIVDTEENVTIASEIENFVDWYNEQFPNKKGYLKWNPDKPNNPLFIDSNGKEHPGPKLMTLIRKHDWYLFELIEALGGIGNNGLFTAHKTLKDKEVENSADEDNQKSSFEHLVDTKAKNTLMRSFYSSDVRDHGLIDHTNIENYRIVLSRNPYLISEASTNQVWESCMDEYYGGAYNKKLPHAVREGSMIAYIVHKDDVNMRYPLMRRLIHPGYMNQHNKDHDPAFLVTKHYGVGKSSQLSSAFVQTLTEFFTDYNADKKGTYHIEGSLYADGYSSFEPSNPFDRHEVESTQNGVYYLNDGQILYKYIEPILDEEFDKFKGKKTFESEQGPFPNVALLANYVSLKDLIQSISDHRKKAQKTLSNFEERREELECFENSESFEEGFKKHVNLIRSRYSESFEELERVIVEIHKAEMKKEMAFYEEVARKTEKSTQESKETFEKLKSACENKGDGPYKKISVDKDLKSKITVVKLESITTNSDSDEGATPEKTVEEFKFDINYTALELVKEIKEFCLSHHTKVTEFEQKERVRKVAENLAAEKAKAAKAESKTEKKKKSRLSNVLFGLRAAFSMAMSSLGSSEQNKQQDLEDHPEEPLTATPALDETENVSDRLRENIRDRVTSRTDFLRQFAELPTYRNTFETFGNETLEDYNPHGYGRNRYTDRLRERLQQENDQYSGRMRRRSRKYKYNKYNQLETISENSQNTYDPVRINIEDFSFIIRKPEYPHARPRIKRLIQNGFDLRSPTGFAEFLNQIQMGAHENNITINRDVVDPLTSAYYNGDFNFINYEQVQFGADHFLSFEERKKLKSIDLAYFSDETLAKLGTSVPEETFSLLRQAANMQVSQRVANEYKKEMPNLSALEMSANIFPSHHYADVAVVMLADKHDINSDDLLSGTILFDRNVNNALQALWHDSRPLVRHSYTIKHNRESAVDTLSSDSQKIERAIKVHAEFCNNILSRKKQMTAFGQKVFQKIARDKQNARPTDVLNLINHLLSKRVSGLKETVQKPEAEFNFHEELRTPNYSHSYRMDML